MNRHNELNDDEALAFDLLVKTIASSSGTRKREVYAAMAAMLDVHNDYTITLTDYQMRYLMNYLYYETGIGREIYGILIDIPILTPSQQMTFRDRR